MFQKITDSRSEEVKYGTGLKGQSRVPANKAHRFNLVGAIATKVASAPNSLTDLFGAPKDAQKKPPKAKKVLPPEEQQKKDFEKDMAMSLVSKSQNCNLGDCCFSSVIVFSMSLMKKMSLTRKVIHLIFYMAVDPRISKLAEKARATSLNLTQTGISHQEAGSPFNIQHEVQPVWGVCRFEAVKKDLGYHHDICSELLTKPGSQHKCF